MSDIANPTATATITDTGAKPELVPAVPTPKPTVPSPDKVLEGIKAKIAAANKPGLPAPVDPAKPATEQAKPVDIVPDTKQVMADLAKAHERVRELTEKAKLAETATADATFAKELKELAAKDKLGAVLKLFGGSAEDVLAELVEKHYEGQAGAGTEPGKSTPAAAPEMKAILDKLEAVTKELAEIKGGTAAKTEAEQKAQLAEQEEGTKAYLRSVAAKHKDMFEISSRAENMDEAVGKAIAKTQDPAWAAEKCKELGITDPAKLTPEQAEAFARAAISEAEKEFEQLGSRFAKTRKPEQDSDRVYQRPFSPPAIKFSTKPAKESWDQYRARIAKEWEAQNQ